MRCKMQRLKINQDIRPLSEIRTGIANFIKQVHDTKRPLIIELLTDVQISLSQIENGQGIDHEEAKDNVLKRVQK
jgi:antitoxin YefM